MREREGERKAEGEGEWPSWHVIILRNNLPPSSSSPLSSCCLSQVSHSMLLSLSFSLFLTLSVALYLLNTDCASVGLQLITSVITHILDDLIGEKAYKSSEHPPESAKLLLLKTKANNNHFIFVLNIFFFKQ